MSFFDVIMQPLKSLLANPQTSLGDVLSHPDLWPCFNLPKRKLIFFLFDKIADLIDLAANPASDHRNTAFQIALALSKKFSNEVMASDKFTDHVVALLKCERLDTPTSVVLSRMLGDVVVASNALFLVGLKDRALFFALLVKHIDSLPINTLLCSLASDHRRVMKSFFEAADATNVLLENMTGGCVQCVLFLLTDLISCVEQGSSLFEPFGVRENVERVVAIAVSSTDDLLATHALRLLVAIYLHPGAKVEYIVERIPAICDIVMREDGRFFANKTEAVTLVAVVCDLLDEYPACVKALVMYLFDKVFAFPVHSILHTTFKLLFERFAKGSKDFESFLEESRMRERIVNAFETSDRTKANFWGLLHFIADLADNATTQSDEQWDKFMGTCHATYLQTITDAYGSVASVSSSDNDDILPEDFFGDDEDFVAQDVFGDDGF